jgi:hypothetical protein
MAAHDYCHRLQQLANSLADYDVPVSDQALVHQLIRGLNPKFSVLKTLLPLLPRFPTFIEARELILRDKSSRDAESKRSSETALLAAGSLTPKTENPPPAPPIPECATNTNNFFYGGPGCGCDHDGNQGRGGRNGGCGGGGRNGNNNNNPNAPHRSPSSPWGPAWCVGWRTPWTGMTGPGILGSHPPMPAQAYQAFQPSTMTAPLQAPCWDTSDLLQAL